MQDARNVWRQVASKSDNVSRVKGAYNRVAFLALQNIYLPMQVNALGDVEEKIFFPSFLLPPKSNLDVKFPPLNLPPRPYASSLIVPREFDRILASAISLVGYRVIVRFIYSNKGSVGGRRHAVGNVD